MNQLEPGSDGVYLGKMLSKAVLDKESGAIQISSTIAISHAYLPKEERWDNIEDQDLQVYGNFFIRGREDTGGKYQKKTIEALKMLTGWESGDLTELDEIDMSDTLIQFTCKTYKDKTGQSRIDGGLLSVPQKTPTMGLSSDPIALQKLTSKHAAAIRAIAAGVDSPDAAPEPEAKPAPTSATTPAFDPTTDRPDDVPF